ncbi:MAG: hypothetical protein KIT14_06780 [bacterium]|nr:hypothetical protein [bacterium]
MSVLRTAMNVLVAVMVLAVSAPAMAQPGSCAIGEPDCCADDVFCDDGNPCNGVETCDRPGSAMGACVAGTPVACGPESDACTDLVCNPSSGACEPTPVANGTPCDDDDRCTNQDRCQSGVCTGTPAVFCAGDQCNTAGVCNPLTGACEDIPKTGADCNDTNPCTVGDKCTATGVCQGTPKVCTAKDQCHDAGTCNPSTGACSDPPKTNGTGCSDGNACTLGDTCQAGGCTPGAADACDDGDACTTDACDGVTGCSHTPIPGCRSCDVPADCADGNPCTADLCTAGVCSNPPSSGTPCNDGNACTQSDVCQNGVCTGSNPVVCTAKDQCHDAGVCDTSTGLCSTPAKTNGTGCNDGNACTQSDVCQNGVCTGSNPVVCTAKDQCHDAGVCNPQTGLCSDPPKADATPCSDGAFCTVGDTCRSGICTGTPRDCASATDQCNTGVCDEARDVCAPEPRPDDTGCSDGNACTAGDRCVAGVCTATGPTDCADGDACTVDTCGANGCEHVELSGCRSCNTDLECNDDNFCTDDSCDAGRCRYSNRSDPCDDGNRCTESDRCSAGVCVGTAKACPGATGCFQAATCAPQTGECVALPRPDGTTCNDQNACTRTDRCEAGTCEGSEPIVCTAQDQCRDAGVCNPQTGACSNPAKPDDTVCDDADPCTSGDRCVGGTCAATPLDCNDGVACTTDTCAAGVCRHTPADTGCDAGECATGACRPGDPGADARGCVVASVAPDGTLCTDDGIPCTEDVCTAGGCRHVVRDDRCPPPNECGTAVCQPAQPGADAAGCVQVESRADGAECSEDDDPCSDDRCGDGVCGHANVENYQGCVAVLGPWRRVRGLLDTSRAIDGRLSGLGTPDAPPAAEARALLDDRLATLREQLVLIERTLAGRSTSVLVPSARADMPGGGIITDTPARIRGRIAFAQVKKTPRAAQAFLSMLTLAKQRAALDRDTARDLRRRGRTLLTGTKALKRDLKRLQKLRQSFAR